MDPVRNGGFAAVEDEPMKIAMIVPGGVDRGGERRVIPCLLWVIERLAREHEVHVFALRQEPRPCTYGLLGAAIHVAGARPRRLRLLGQFAREHRRSPFDAIHARWAAPPGVLAAILGRVFGIPVLLRLTGGDMASIPAIRYGQRRTWRGRLWLRLAVRGASHITVPSASMQRSAKELGIRAERLPWGVATDRWPPLPPRPRDANRPARLIWVGTLNRVKNPEMLLRTAQILRARECRFRLDVIGEDTRGGEIQRMAGELGLDDSVRFRGFLTQAELRAEMAAADLLLLTSWHEADPVVLFEAASAGVPAAGAAVGHLIDWAPEAAFAVPVNDADALADAVSLALSDDPLRIRVAEAAQRRALDEDCDRCVRRLNEIYRSLAGREPSAFAARP